MMSRNHDTTSVFKFSKLSIIYMFKFSIQAFQVLALRLFMALRLQVSILTSSNITLESPHHANKGISSHLIASFML